MKETLRVLRLLLRKQGTLIQRILKKLKTRKKISFGRTSFGNIIFVSFVVML